jgi:hypothetical protein
MLGEVHASPSLQRRLQMPKLTEQEKADLQWLIQLKQEELQVLYDLRDKAFPSLLHPDMIARMKRTEKELADMKRRLEEG